MYFTALPPPFFHIVAQSGGKDECAEKISPGMILAPGVTKKGFYTVFQLDQKTLFDFQLPVPISTIAPYRVFITDPALWILDFLSQQVYLPLSVASKCAI
jgi:hypothetical protein